MEAEAGQTNSQCCCRQKQHRKTRDFPAFSQLRVDDGVPHTLLRLYCFIRSLKEGDTCCNFLKGVSGVRMACCEVVYPPESEFVEHSGVMR